MKPENPGLIRNILIAVKASRKGLTGHGVLEALAQNDSYPSDWTVRSLLSTLVKRGVLSKDEYIACKGCGRRLAVYRITGEGLRRLR